MIPSASYVPDIQPSLFAVLPDGKETRRPSRKKARCKKAQRKELDRYDTPDWPTRALLALCPGICGDVLLDPCSGNGRMSELLAPRFGVVRTNDLDPTTPAQTHLDAAHDSLYRSRPAWVVSNPPFNAAGAIVFRALLSSVHGVAMLLRITFLEPCAASPAAPRNGRLWLGDYPPTRQIVLPRIDFNRDGGSDSATACWFIWANQRGVVEPGICVVSPERLEQLLGQTTLSLEGVRS